MTLLSMAAPVVFTLLVLLQRESVSGAAAARLLAARSSMAAQLRLLEEGRPLTLNANALAVRSSAFPVISKREFTGLSRCRLRREAGL